MYIGSLYLEITRTCTLMCEHCLRGNRGPIHMSKETIDNVFGGVMGIQRLLISGGEPLLAIKQIRYIIEAIRRRGTSIGDILIVTNGTVLSEEIIETLKELSEVAEIRISISDDIFHQLEVKRLGLVEQRSKNIQRLQELQGKFRISMYEFGTVTNETIIPRGRAKDLTPERLNQINSLYSTNYCIGGSSDATWEWHRLPGYQNGYLVGGELSIDVNGNVTGYDLSYDQEDAMAQEGNFNVNGIGLANAVINFSTWYRELGKEEAQHKTGKS